MDLKTAKPVNLLTIILTAAVTAAVVTYAANNVRSVNKIIG